MNSKVQFDEGKPSSLVSGVPTAVVYRARSGSRMWVSRFVTKAARTPHYLRLKAQLRSAERRIWSTFHQSVPELHLELILYSKARRVSCSFPPSSSVMLDVFQSKAYLGLVAGFRMLRLEDQKLPM